MTFKFRIWPFGSGAEKARWTSKQKPVHERPVLLGKWQRGKDGRLERHWEKKEG